MKNKTYRFAAVAAVLLVLLVFTAPVGAEEVAKVGDVSYDNIYKAIIAATSTEDKTVLITGTVSSFDLAMEKQYDGIWFYQVDKSGVTLEGTESGKIGGITVGNSKLHTSLDNMVIKNLTIEGGYIHIGKYATTLKNLQIVNCTFIGENSDKAAIQIFINKADADVSGLTIKNNTISGYHQGILLNGNKQPMASSTIIISQNNVDVQHNAVQCIWKKPSFIIEDNTFVSALGNPVNQYLTEADSVSFSGNKIYFTENFVETDFTNSEDGTMPGKAMYNIRGFLSLDTGDNHFYIGTPESKTEVTGFAALMEHLYPEKSGVIVVDGTGDVTNGYSSGYLSVGEEGSPDGYVAEGFAAVQIGQTKEQEAYTEGDNKGTWKSDRVMKHYIIGKDAQSTDMKLTAGNFVTDPSDFVAENYHVKVETDDTFTVTDKWTVTFKDGDKIHTTNATVVNNTAVTEPTQPTKEGHTFAGWCTDAEGTTAFSFATPVTSDVTLYANWTINQYTITFDTDGGNTIAPITQDYGTAITAPNAPTKYGYTFAGWDKAIPTTMPAEDMTITAKWTYTYNGGGNKNNNSPKPQEQPTEPVTPTEPVAGEVTVETEVTNGGEVSFETPAVEGSEPVADAPVEISAVVLPEGTTGEVSFIPVSEKPAPAGKETQTKKVFEINVPQYDKGKAAVVKFTMTVAELTADGKTAADVALWHFDEETGEWTKLVTSYTIVDGIVYFEAITYDFSPFAIIYEDAAVEEPEQPTEEPETPASPAPVLGILAALGAAVVLRRK